MPAGTLPGCWEKHGAELLAPGWTAADASGLHATAPGAAVDCYGLVMLMDGCTVAQITAGGAKTIRPSGAVLSFRRGTGRPAVPAWSVVT